MNHEIYKATIGSHCHGLNDENSDYDYKGVFIAPTKEILDLNTIIKNSHKIDAKEDKDSDSLEIGHFLALATDSNPTILETFKTPEYDIVTCETSGMPGPWKPGQELRDLFPHVWSSRRVHDAFKGYSRSQLKRMFGDKDNAESQRKFKHATAYLRVLLSGIELLVTENFNTVVQQEYRFEGFDFPSLPSPRKLGGGEYRGWFYFLKAVRAEEVTMGAVIDVSTGLMKLIDEAYEFNPDKQTNLEPINEFLLKVRREFWD